MKIAWNLPKCLGINLFWSDLQINNIVIDISYNFFHTKKGIFFIVLFNLSQYINLRYCSHDKPQKNQTHF